MDVEKLRKELNSLYDEVSNADFNDKYQIKEAFFRLIRFNENLIANIDNHESSNKQDVKINNLENNFVTGVHEIINNGATLNVDILNWYRNLYYKEGNNTERGIIAHVINDIFMEMNVKNIKLTRLYTSPESKDVN